MADAEKAYMQSPLVLWVETFKANDGHPLEYRDLYEGVFLNDVMQQIFSRLNNLLTSTSVYQFSPAAALVSLNPGDAFLLLYAAEAVKGWTIIFQYSFIPSLPGQCPKIRYRPPPSTSSLSACGTDNAPP
ncbi:protein daple [Plakobranchus ocellatus]|uniref:Protein daple n=1 Tax=Plakobranchus ocellatus TaxID=259542 RepID=A0AAV3ZX66_9GAST|nr:protein daple [Plakobranchus ocellatus]